MYTIIKPEMRRYLSSIDDVFAENGFRINSRHSIEDWPSLARKVYAHQAKEDETFASSLEAYLWLTKHFFGDYATAFLLEKEGDLLENLKQLGKTKKQFREQIERNGAEAVHIILNIDRVDPSGKYKIGLRGKLGVGDHIFEDSQKFEGRWDYFFFKYIHIPDPDLPQYQREMTILQEEGILNNYLSQEQWEQMKTLQTLIPPKLPK